METTKCGICGEEITKQDEQNGNWVQGSMGGYNHKWCPTQSCEVCGQPLGEGRAKRLPCRATYVHAGCYGRGARKMAEKLERMEERESDPPTWIARR